MSGSGGVSIARAAVRGENRFYNPPAMRKLQQEARLKQRKERKVHDEKQKRGVEDEEEEMKSRGTKHMSDRVDSLERESGEGAEECGSSSCSKAEIGSNLDRFLEHTTPVVLARCMKMRIQEHRTRESECHPYFVLEDLWDAFAEWSVYGVGVPLLLNGNESVVQYYVPYLSGIQLYMDPARPGLKLGRPTIDSDAESLRETSSGVGSVNYGAQNPQNKLSLSDRSTGSLGDESEICNSTDQLVYEYLERDPPFGREPLADKISVLASRFSELMTYRSCDLSPSSWISVAWYPIYRIPIGPTLQNLDACFLTFHSLSTPYLSKSTVREISNPRASVKLPLPTFGLASYKFKASLWGVDECKKANSLIQAADNWIKRLQVEHPDYRFFVSRNTQMR